MIFEELASYKVLQHFGCKNSSGPIQSKKGIVVMSISGSNATYHFNPNYSGIARAIRSGARGPTVLFEREFKGLETYDLAFMAFILNFMSFKKIQNLTPELWAKTVLKKKETIFYNIFEVGK